MRLRRRPQLYLAHLAETRRNRVLRAPGVVELHTRVAVARVAVGVERIAGAAAESGEAYFAAAVDAAGCRQRSSPRWRENYRPVGFRAQVHLTPLSAFRERQFGFAHLRVLVASQECSGREDREPQDFRPPCSGSVDQPQGPSVGCSPWQVDRTDWL